MKREVVSKIDMWKVPESGQIQRRLPYPLSTWVQCCDRAIGALGKGDFKG